MVHERCQAICINDDLWLSTYNFESEHVYKIASSPFPPYKRREKENNGKKYYPFPFNERISLQLLLQTEILVSFSPAYGMLLFRYEFKTNYEEWIKLVKPKLGPDVSDCIQAATTTTPDSIKNLYKVRTEMRAALQNLLKVLVTIFNTIKASFFAFGEWWRSSCYFGIVFVNIRTSIVWLLSIISKKKIYFVNFHKGTIKG